MKSIILFLVGIVLVVFVMVAVIGVIFTAVINLIRMPCRRCNNLIHGDSLRLKADCKYKCSQFGEHNGRRFCEAYSPEQ